MRSSVSYMVLTHDMPGVKVTIKKVELGVRYEFFTLNLASKETV
jgi:hypothetical protein